MSFTDYALFVWENAQRVLRAKCDSAFIAAPID